jgi:hypothetical protein
MNIHTLHTHTYTHMNMVASMLGRRWIHTYIHTYIHTCIHIWTWLLLCALQVGRGCREGYEWSPSRYWGLLQGWQVLRGADKTAGGCKHPYMYVSLHACFMLMWIHVHIMFECKSVWPRATRVASCTWCRQDRRCIGCRYPCMYVCMYVCVYVWQVLRGTDKTAGV